MAIGTETEGSLISPSTRSSLYTVKPTLGSVPNEGVMPVSFHLDTAGPMCRCVKDTADLLTVLVGDGRPDVPSGGYAAAMKGAAGWRDLRVGTLDPEKFRYDETLQTPVPEAIEQIVSGMNVSPFDSTDSHFVKETSHSGRIRPDQVTCKSLPLRCQPLSGQ